MEGGVDGDRRGAGGEFTVGEGVEALRGDDHLSPAALVLVLAVRDLRGAVLGKRVVLRGGGRVNTASQQQRQQHASHHVVSGGGGGARRRTCSSDWGMALSMATGAW